MRWSGLPPTRVAPLMLAALCAVMFLAGLGSVPLTNPNEGLYAEVAREMLERHDPVVPRVDGVLYLEKPPLLYWLSAASMEVFGPTAFAARLPSALAGIATVWLVFWAGRRLWGRPRGLVSAAILATSLGFAALAHEVLFDALLTLWVTAAILLFWLGGSSGGAPSRDRLEIRLGYAALGLAVLTKGLIGLLLPALVVLGGALLARDGARLRPLKDASGVTIFLAVVIPWHTAIALRQPEFLSFYFWNEHVLRFLGRRRPRDFHADPISVTLAAPLLLAFPWSALLPRALARVQRERRALGRVPPEVAFLLLWAALPVLFFTLSGSRAVYYLLPSVPPLAMLLGRDARQMESRRDWGWTATPMLVCLLLVAGFWSWYGRPEPSRAGAREFLALVFATGLLLMLGLGAALLLSLRKARFGPFAPLTAAVVITALATVVIAGKSRSPLFPSEQPLAARIERLHPPEGTLVAVHGRLENHSSFLFYLSSRFRPARIVEGREGGDLEFGSTFAPADRIFLDRKRLEALARERPLFYLTENPPKSLLPSELEPVERSPNAILWANAQALRHGIH